LPIGRYIRRNEMAQKMVTKAMEKAFQKAGYDQDEGIKQIPIITQYFHCMQDFDMYVLAGKEESNGDWTMMGIFHQHGDYELACFSLNVLIADSKGMMCNLERQTAWNPGYKTLGDIVPDKYIEEFTKGLRKYVEYIPE